MIKWDNVTFDYPENYSALFNNLSLNIKHGITSCIGQNGSGKTTFLLLSAGLLHPTNGTISLLGRKTTDLTSIEDRQKLVSFIYQNMEFETEETIEELLNSVYYNGFHLKKDNSLINQIIEIFELKKLLNKKTGEISKGELQRVIIGFSLLYGSKIIIMDEPVFALESHQKKNIFQYLQTYAKDKSISIVFSAHELELSKNYSEHLCLFHKDHSILHGETKDIYKEELIEKAYNLPFAFLKQEEVLYRQTLS